MRNILLAAVSFGCLNLGAMSAQANMINGTFAGAVSRSIVDTGNLFGLGSTFDVNGRAVTGTFSYDLNALSAVTVINNAGGTAGQTDYSWTNNTGAVSLSLTTGTTTTTVASTVSGGVYRADRSVSGIYQLFEVYANDGVNHIEEYFVSHVPFLNGFGTTTPDYVFTLPSGGAVQYGESYLTVGSFAQIVTNDSTVTTTLITTEDVPEPGSMALIGAGLAAVGFARGRRRAGEARR